MTLPLADPSRSDLREKLHATMDETAALLRVSRRWLQEFLKGRPGLYRRAGFREVGETKGGLMALQLAAADVPPARAALPRSTIGLPLFSRGAA